MATKRGGRNSPAKPPQARGGSGKGVLGFLLGAAVAGGAGYLYLHSTPHSPEPTAPTSTLPVERPRTEQPAPTPPPSPTPRVAPFGISEDVFESGARQYAARCASCHGTPQKDAATTPPAKQLWRAARKSIAAQTPSDLYNEISGGMPAQGMPAYAHTLTETQIWQLALLLKNANGELPDPVVTLLNAPPKPRTSAASK